MQICFSVFLILYAYFENTLKELRRSQRVHRRQKTLSVHGDHGDFRVVLFYKVVSEYAKSILSCTEKTLKAFKRIRRIRQEYIAAYGEYADRHKTEPFSANFRPRPKKFQILNHHSIEEAKNTSNATVPFSLANGKFCRA